MFTKLFLSLVTVSCVLSTPVSHPRGPSEVTGSRFRSMPFNVKFDGIGVKNFAQQERERAQRFIEARTGAAIGNYVKRQDENDTVPVANALVTYLAEVEVGNPPSKFQLVIDTGSSNTWVGANTTKPYVQTSTSKTTNDQVQVTYGSGQFAGTEFFDQVTLGPGLVIKNQSIGAANMAQGFDGTDGILGVGPVDLTVGTLQNAFNTPIPTVVDNLFAQGTIESPELGVFFAPSNSSDFLLSGTLTFGGIAEDMLTSNVSFVPITQQAPSNAFWGIDQVITYGNESMPLLNSTAGIVDTGTTLLLLPTESIQAYQRITGGVLDQTTGLLSVTAAQMSNLQSLFFHIGNETYELTPDAQVFPPSLNTQIGGVPDAIYLVLADLGTDIGSGLDFINGFAFLQRFYSVYDTANSRVGFATTTFTNSMSSPMDDPMDDPMNDPMGDPMGDPMTSMSEPVSTPMTSMSEPVSTPRIILP